MRWTMKCDRCKVNDANVVIKHNINNIVNELHLCESCIKSLGLQAMNSPFWDLASPLSLGENFFKALKQIEQPVAVNTGVFVSDQDEKIVCKACNMSLVEFREKGKLGCNQCYGYFHEQLDQLFRRIQSKESHCGRHSAQEPERVEIIEARESIKRLRDDIREAVDREDYQRAALCKQEIEILSKKIRELSSVGKGGTAGAQEEQNLLEDDQ